MRDRVDDSDFLLQRELERLLAARLPDRFVPRYTMVTFRTTRYSVALERGNLQREILTAATDGLTSPEQVDLAAVEREVLARLSPL